MKLCRFLFHHLFLLSSAFSILDFPLNSQVSIPVPSGAVEGGFHGRAFILGAAGKDRHRPGFRLALSVEAIALGEYRCSLVVLLGDVEVWSSDHLLRFLVRRGCTLKLAGDGDLQLSDMAVRRVGWRTGTSFQGVQRLQLESRTGNLILADTMNRTRWQSFDYPTNIMLWRQQLRPPANLTSFPAVSPSVSYSMEIQRSKLVAYLIWGSYKYSYWEFNPSFGRRITIARLGSKGLKLLDNRLKKIGQIEAMNLETVRFMKLGISGSLEMYYYSATEVGFKLSYRVPSEFCNLPLSCPPCEICSSSDNTCKKLSWMTCNQNGFCQDLNSRMEMLEMVGIDAVLRTESPAQATNISRKGCLNSCLEDCSCAAVMYYEGDGDGRNSECCKYGMVIGAREGGRGNGSSYWVKIQRERGSNQALKEKFLILGGIVDGVAICLILGGLVYYVIWRIRNTRNNFANCNN
ncbi:G-type lectin S-receptor-like serine/threonine-protein kinase SD2-5 [Apostasia shenzhenica]|uniref:G-type lectin S-receptor-like serine/threonine-protein kinase SD2-5 n=1 Tax=Apostasia shenzhenica TaxID=1088818 RepID=A0A2I0A8K0_9ASPA|nr:G-type lectin S-receptor-like serine/threonine-protein kinase SD2-5 [Apostasia shenzhenica]